MQDKPPRERSAFGRAVNTVEEAVIALILGLMTAITFVNVPIRYLFDGITLPRVEFLWAVEATSILFAWLVIFGIGYCVKVRANLGVDAVIDHLPPSPRRGVGIIAGIACIIYSAMLLKAGWDFFAPFANLPPTTGRWLPTGLSGNYLAQGWYEVNDIPMPSWLGFLADVFNEGERYEKLPRVIPYIMLPIGTALLLFRFIQATLRIVRGETDRLIVAHEAEDQVAEASADAAARG